MNVFKKYIPITKSKDSNDNWYISGIASTPTKDWEGDTIDPRGLDITYLMKQGKINYEHKNTASHIIGEPTNNTFVDGNGLHLEAMLYKDQPLAQDTWELANAMEKSNAKRSVGFSIEGVGQADPNNEHRINKVKVYNVAVTTNQANPDAQWHTFTKSFNPDSEIVKAMDGGMTTGTATPSNQASNLEGYAVDPQQLFGVSAFRKEDLPKAISYLTSVLSRKDKDSLLNYAQKELSNKNLLSLNSKALILQLGRGLSYDSSINFLKERKD